MPFDLFPARFSMKFPCESRCKKVKPSTCIHIHTHYVVLYKEAEGGSIINYVVALRGVRNSLKLSTSHIKC